jgi:hypothetical protein
MAQKHSQRTLAIMVACCILVLLAVSSVTGQATTPQQAPDQTQVETSIAFVNAYAGSSSVDAYIGNKIFASSIPYTYFTAYSGAGSGDLVFNATGAGSAVNIASARITTNIGHDYTLVLHGRTDVPSFAPGFILFDDTAVNRCPIDTGYGRLRFCHTAPGAVVVDVIGTVVSSPDGYIYTAKTLSFGQCSDEILLKEASYTFLAINSGQSMYMPIAQSSTVLLVQRNHVYNLYLMGAETFAAAPLKFGIENTTPCSDPVAFQPVPAPRVPGGSAGENQFVPFVAPGADVAPFQPQYPTVPPPTVPIIYGPRRPIVWAAASTISSSVSMLVVVVLVAIVSSW